MTGIIRIRKGFWALTTWSKKRWLQTVIERRVVDVSAMSPFSSVLNSFTCNHWSLRGNVINQHFDDSFGCISVPVVKRTSQFPRIAGCTRKFSENSSGIDATKILTACSTVIGLSVLSWRVIDETPRMLVSSWIPPESVKTTLAPDVRCRKSRYPRSATIGFALVNPTVQDAAQHQPKGYWFRWLPRKWRLLS